jgi:ABC-type phosphate/phosphonate transport system ATPase subunit
MAQTVLQSKSINKYFKDPVTVQVLKDISFSINQGEFVSVVGQIRMWKIYTFVHSFHHGHRL